MAETEYTGWKRWLQSKFVLGTARRIYLVVASLSLLVAILAAGAVLLFQILALKPTFQAPVPEERAHQPVSMDANTVAASLVPPRNLRFVAFAITSPLVEGDPVGYFDADTQNGLAQFPNDFDIFGGPDADKFERVPVSVQYGGRTVSRAGLRPSAALRAEINRTFPDSFAQQRKSFSLKVVARDRFGTAAHPADVFFTLTWGPAPPAPQESAPVAEAPPVSDLQRLARAIALYLDPKRTSVYFDQYKRALKVPGECGVADDNADFIRGFDDAFNRLKPHLNLSNIGAFYAGVCAAWVEGATKEAANQQAADAARQEVINKNEEAVAADSDEKESLNNAKYFALSVVIGAASAFLFISLFLAFLAIENHSDALRQAVEALADRK